MKKKKAEGVITNVLLGSPWESSLGNMMRTHWEQGKINPKKIPFVSLLLALNFFKKKLDLSCVHAESSHWLHETCAQGPNLFKILCDFLIFSYEF